MARVPAGTIVKVLIFTAVSAVLTVALLVRIGNLRPFADTYRLEAVFEDATGIFEGDAVKVAGVDVGRVRAARVERGEAVVEFDVDESVELPPDSVVAIRWRNVLGQRFLYLHPGTAAGPGLDDGDRIPVDQTRTAGDIGHFLNRLGPVLRAIDPEKANAFVEAMNTALSGNEVLVRQLVTDGAVLAGELGEMDDQIRTLVGSSSKVMQAYASEEESIGSIIENLDLLGGRLRGMTADINSLVENFAVVQRELNRLLRENRGNIDASLRDLRVVARTLEANRARFADTICTLPPGLAAYAQTTSWGEWFNVRITKAIVRDDQGRTIVSESEQPLQRPHRDHADPFVGCSGEQRQRGRELEGITVGPERIPPVDAAASDDGFEDVGAFVRFVTGGR